MCVCRGRCSPSSDMDSGAVRFKLRCSHGTTHCRIRAGPSLSTPEVGDVADGSAVLIAGQVEGLRG